MIKCFDKLYAWVLQKYGLAHWDNLYDWFVDTTQKIGIGGIILGLFQNNTSGSIVGALLLFISAFMTLTNTRK